MSKFLTYEERLIIQSDLKEQMSFGEIGKILRKDRTTIAKEIKKHSYEKKSCYPGFSYNSCKYRNICKAKDICNRDDCKRKTTSYCKLCPYCNDRCSEFREEHCAARFKPPYVCNGCGQLDRCSLKKVVYDAYDAHLTFSKNISEARTGILTDEDELQRLNDIISPLVNQGQSVHQIYATHVDELMCREKTIYNYIDACLFDVRNIDLPRKVKYRPRYKKPEFKVDRGCRIGRIYDNFKAFLEEFPDTSVVQMDSVIGSKGGKVLLTIHFLDTSLMLAFLRNNNTSKSVIDIWDSLFHLFGREIFVKLFPVVVTDNGSEFSNPTSIEYGPKQNDILRTRIFYCDPSSPYQKGAIEVNHELIRRILPKGSNFENLTQDDINLMMDHINSYKRKKLNDHSPYEAFSFLHGEEILHKLRCHSVAAEDIIMNKSLLKK